MTDGPDRLGKRPGFSFSTRNRKGQRKVLRFGRFTVIHSPRGLTVEGPDGTVIYDAQGKPLTRPARSE